MRRINEQVFTALRVEGGLLPAEFLQRVASFEAGSQTGSDYGVSKALSLKDEIGRFWRIAAAEWQDYRDRRQRSDAKASQIGVQIWLTRLLTDVLGYRDLQPAT